MSLQGVEIVEAKGRIVRDCPGTKNHICCGYKTIDIVEGCPLGCSYCILKHYINYPRIKVVRDLSYIINQIREEVKREEGHIMRFGTGELSDSLAIDKRYRLNKGLIEFFGEEGSALLELKSKWAYIDHLVHYLNPYTIISFSLAPQRLIAMEEKRTSTVKKRLKAARKAQEMGCFVGLHLDPVIIYEGFEADYASLIDEIADTLDLERVIWVSIGLLRFPAGMLKHFIDERRRNLLYGEFIVAEDGKYRYIKRERLRVYKMLYHLLKQKAEGLFVYLCMERPDIWRELTGIELHEDEDLIRLFDKRIKELYGGRI